MGTLLKIGASIVGGIMDKKAGDKQAKAIAEGGKRSVAALQPFAEPGAAANTSVMDALGQNGEANQDAQFQNFLGSTGFQAQLTAGSNAITGSAGAKGLLNSGSTLKRLNTFGQDLASQGFSKFIGGLSGVADRGLSAGAGIAGTESSVANQSAAAARSGSTGLQEGIGQGFEIFNTRNDPAPAQTAPAV
jgi:hypothetical protein